MSGRTTLADQLAARAVALRGVVDGPSRFGSGKARAFTYHGKEFAHFHSASVIDVRVGRKGAKRWKDDPRLIPRKSASDWVELRIRGADDLDAVFEAVRIAYEEARARAKPKG